MIVTNSSPLRPRDPGGTLVFRNTRMSAQTLSDYFEDGYSLDELIAIFPSMDRNSGAELLRLVRANPMSTGPYARLPPTPFEILDTPI